MNPVPGSLVQFEDSAFTQTEKEQGQAFVWYVTVKNVRGDSLDDFEVHVGGAQRQPQAVRQIGAFALRVV